MAKAELEYADADRGRLATMRRSLERLLLQASDNDDELCEVMEADLSPAEYRSEIKPLEERSDWLQFRIDRLTALIGKAEASA